MTEYPASDYVTFTWNGEEFHAKKKFKRLKFLRFLDSGSLFSAFALAVEPEELERLEEFDLEEPDLEDLMEILSKAILGKGPDAKGN